MFHTLKKWAHHLKSQILILYFAYKDKRVSIIPRLFAIVVVAYACSPIDLIPDFIPILGYVDDVIIVPLGIYFAMKMIPPVVLADCREKVRNESLKKPKNWLTGAIFIIIWVILIAWLFWLIGKQYFQFKM